MLELLYAGSEKGSSATLLITAEHTIVVDTSTPEVRDEIIMGLEKVGLGVEDVDVVVNTHIHPRHIGNNDLFKKAEVFASPHEFVKKFKGCLMYDEVLAFKDVKELVDDEIRIINTPGHTWGSISLIHEDYVIVGDAIPYKSFEFKKCVDDISARGSVNRILRLGKKIITGHDGVLECLDVKSAEHNL